MPRRGLSSSTATNVVVPTAQIPITFSDGLPLPRLFVFDLDYTLWPFWVDTHVCAPLKPTSKDPQTNNAMIDATGETFTFYREVPGILYSARQKGISMGLASRTHAPDLAGVMLKNIMVPPPPAPAIQPQGEPQINSKEKAVKAWDFFTYREIYPGSKITHFEKIHSASKKKESGGEVAYEDMVFFDDESRNRDVERKHGVTFVLVRDGVTRDEVDRGVNEWRRRKGISTKPNSSLEDGIAELE